VSRHPCQYSPEVLDVLAELIRPGEHIHDPYAGPGLRLGRLCDQLGATFTGTDIENWGLLAEGKDPRVALGDAGDHAGYPAVPFTATTSPVYGNKRCCDYPNGPHPTTKVKGRRDYGIAKGSALELANLARTTGHKFARDQRPYWEGHALAVKHWDERAIVNVDEPIGDGWCRLLEAGGFTIESVIPAFTRRYGGLDNAEKRADHEVVIVATKKGMMEK